ncbi:MAG TPA: FHA domain-containing protein [Anaeromyxobacteraceae bacterium]|nr:FHA domain-containing protein [Anaeromyxobacteraceae bacterium]
MPRHTRLIAARILGHASTGRTPACGPRLAIVAGPDTGRVLPVSGGDVLGRGAGAQLRLRDQATSRAHLRLEETAGELAIVDLGSKNGVELNGRRVRSRAPVRNGDQVRVGATVLEVAGLEDAIADPSPSAIAGASPAAADLEVSPKGDSAGPRLLRAAAALLLTAGAALVAAGL